MTSKIQTPPVSQHLVLSPCISTLQRSNCTQMLLFFIYNSPFSKFSTLTLKQNSVVSLGGSQSQLIKGDHFSTSFQNPSTRTLSHMKSTNLKVTICCQPIDAYVACDFSHFCILSVPISLKRAFLVPMVLIAFRKNWTIKIRRLHFGLWGRLWQRSEEPSEPGSRYTTTPAEPH